MNAVPSHYPVESSAPQLAGSAVHLKKEKRKCVLSDRIYRIYTGFTLTQRRPDAYIYIYVYMCINIHVYTYIYLFIELGVRVRVHPGGEGGYRYRRRH